MVRKCKICNCISNREHLVDNIILCDKHFKMLLEAGLLFEYEADTDWHYGYTNTLDLSDSDKIKSINECYEIINML